MLGVLMRLLAVAAEVAVAEVVGQDEDDVGLARAVPARVRAGTGDEHHRDS